MHTMHPRLFSPIPLLGSIGLICFTHSLALADIPYATGQTITEGEVNVPVDQSGGFKFRNTSGTPITITQLGRWVNAGNKKTHALSIYDTSPTPVQVATVTIHCAGAPAGRYLYGTLPSPHILPAGASCYIVSSETAGGDTSHHNGGTNLTTTNIGTIVSARIVGGRAIDGSDETRSFGPVSFQYSAPLPSWTKTGNSYMTDGSQYSVQAAITDSTPGDIVKIPPGEFTWGAAASPLAVSKAITLAGAGRNLTTIHIAPDAGTYGNGAIVVSAAASIHSLTVTQPGVTTTTAFAISGGNGWRISDITYHSAATAGYFVTASTPGLIDHCTLNLGGGSDEAIFLRGPANAWQTPSTIGTTDAVFIEDCLFNNAGYVCDYNSNARGVVRYCTITGTAKVDAHGLASNTPARGVRQMEVYHNNWTSTSSFWTAIEIRGGTGMIFDNTAAGDSPANGWFQLTDYGYQAQWPNFGNAFQTPADYPLKDQIGVGMDPKTGGSEPLYLWNNLRNGSPWTRTLHAPDPGAISLYGSAFTESDMIKADRDFFASSGFDGIHTFDGSKGVGRGTKAEMLAIAGTKTGVGFWVTDEGTWNLPAEKVTPNSSGCLYTWNGSAWVLKYTPCVYPHPLLSKGDSPERH